jgi:hypothetical protein
MKSKLFKLNVRDIVRAVVMAFITALLTGTYKIIQTGATLDWVTFRPVVMASFAAAIAYLLKNVLTNSNDEMFTKEPA